MDLEKTCWQTLFLLQSTSWTFAEKYSHFHLNMEIYNKGIKEVGEDKQKKGIGRQLSLDWYLNSTLFRMLVVSLHFQIIHFTNSNT